MADGHDDWHQHSPEEGPPQAEHGSTVSPSALGVTLLAIVFGVAFVIVILTAYFQSFTDRYKAEKQEGIPAARSEYLSARATAEARLREAGVVNRDEGVYRLPFDRAVELVTADYAESSARSTTPTSETLTSESLPAEGAPSDDAS